MTEPPFWITNTPGAPGIHNTPAPSYEAQSLSTDQTTAMWNKLLESVWQQFLLWVNGFLAPGPAGPQLTDWIQANQDNIIGDIAEVFTGVEDGDVNDLGSWINALFGRPGSTSINANFAALRTDVTRLQQAGNPGQSVIVDFTTLANSTNLPGFTQSYFGSGTNPYGIVGGRAQEGFTGNNQARLTFAHHATVITDTDTQSVSGVWTSGPVDDIFGNYAYCGLVGRCHATDPTFVYAQFSSISAELGCVNNGTTTALKTIGNGGTGSFYFKPGAVYTLYCGTPSPASADRVFVVTENDEPLITFTDGTAISQMGASYRGGGIAAQWPSSVGNIRPGLMAYWGFADN